MPPAKNKTKVNKKLKSKPGPDYKERLAKEAAALVSMPATAEMATVESDMTEQQRKWRQDLLNEIEQTTKISAASEPTINNATEPTQQSDLKTRLIIKKSKKHRFVWVPLLAIIIYSSLFLLRLDYYIPAIADYLPWPTAYVDGRVIWLDEVKSETKLVNLLEALPNNEEVALNHLIEEALIDKKFSEFGLAVSSSELEQQLYSLAQEFGSTDAFFKYLQDSYEMSVDEFVERVLAPYLRRLSIQKYLNNDPEAAFNTENEAKIVQSKITAKEMSFEEAANQFSDDSLSAAQGGSLGWFTWGTMIPEFESSLRILKKGEISSPIKTEYGYHLLRLDDTKGEVPTNGVVDETSGVLASHIFFKVADFNSWLENLQNSVRLIKLLPIKS